ncbi:DNA ligase [Yinghuangia sp. KLBMP8922]|uniref:DNA ligase n=2 Tax=Yinghuangia soli TaxID=2908204 RepID=A0AA41TZ69_9ACTN|nr:DNA ligase [Yinghuangia soli]
MPGGTRYELKLDGFRALAFARGPGRTMLQSRTGRDLAPGFPLLADAIAHLPEGVVLDGEIVATVDGVFAFEQLLRTRTAREADDVAVSYICFDLLAHPEHGDLRQHPLAERLELLTDVLTGAGPPLEQVMATRDRDEALHWRNALAAAGIEGLVCKGMATLYRPKAAAHRWLKHRRSDSTDARLLGFAGTARRPRTLLLELADGRTIATTPQLDTRQARQIADASAGRLGTPVRDPEHGQVFPLADPLVVEVALSTGRHATARFLRLRGD